MYIHGPIYIYVIYIYVYYSKRYIYISSSIPLITPKMVQQPSKPQEGLHRAIGSWHVATFAWNSLTSPVTGIPTRLGIDGRNPKQPAGMSGMVVKPCKSWDKPTNLNSSSEASTLSLKIGRLQRLRRNDSCWHMSFLSVEVMEKADENPKALDDSIANSEGKPSIDEYAKFVESRS